MAQPHAEAIERHEAPKGFIWRYIFSLDHKVIGVQYYLLALVSLFVGLTLSILMRLHLVWPQASVPLLDKLSPLGAPHGVISPEYYLSLLTMHGTLMVFFVLTTAPQSGFGNYFLIWSMFRGAKAPANPWEATTLEWTIPSPPPFDNFAGKHPVVYNGPYEFSAPGAAKDFIMQNSPEGVAAGH